MLLEKFRRTTNSKSFIAEIDGLRFFAIITVVIFHLNTAFANSIGIKWSSLLGVESFTQPGWWLIRLDLGVKVFFAISGFILSIPFLKQYMGIGEKVKLGDYFYRRITRLEPPFVVTLVGFFLIHVFFLRADIEEYSHGFLASIIYGHTFIYGVPSIINPVTWSLETEAQFYLVIPFIIFSLFLFRRYWFGIAIFLSLFILSILLKKGIIQNGPPNLAYSLLIYLSNFLIGVLFAFEFLKYSSFVYSKSFIWDLIGVLSFFALFYFYKPQYLPLNNLLFNLSLFSILNSLFKGRIINWIFTRQIIYVIGGMCYTIYLLHYALFNLLVTFTKNIGMGKEYIPNLFLQFAICIPILLIVSGIFFLIIEKPCMDKNWPIRVYNWIQKIINK